PVPPITDAPKWTRRTFQELRDLAFPEDRRINALEHEVWRKLALSIIELRGLARRFAVKQPVRTACIEPQYPIPHDLKTHAADLRRLGARRTVIDRRKSQKPSGLRSVLCLLRQAA